MGVKALLFFPPLALFIPIDKTISTPSCNLWESESDLDLTRNCQTNPTMVQQPEFVALLTNKYIKSNCIFSPRSPTGSLLKL